MEGNMEKQSSGKLETVPGGTATMSPSKPNKFKLNKNFDPLPADEGDEMFANGIFEFNVTKMMAFINANPETFPVEQVDVESLSPLPPGNMNEETVQTADLSIPIVLAEISPSRFNVIDGNHRLEKARRDGKESIPAHRVRADQHLAFLTSLKTYESYIRYWNAKVQGE